MQKATHKADNPILLKLVEGVKSGIRTRDKITELIRSNYQQVKQETLRRYVNRYLASAQYYGYIVKVREKHTVLYFSKDERILSKQEFLDLNLNSIFDEVSQVNVSQSNKQNNTRPTIDKYLVMSSKETIHKAREQKSDETGEHVPQEKLGTQHGTSDELKVFAKKLFATAGFGWNEDFYPRISRKLATINWKETVTDDNIEELCLEATRRYGYEARKREENAQLRPINNAVAYWVGIFVKMVHEGWWHQKQAMERAYQAFLQHSQVALEVSSYYAEVAAGAENQYNYPTNNESTESRAPENPSAYTPNEPKELTKQPKEDPRYANDKTDIEADYEALVNKKPEWRRVMEQIEEAPAIIRPRVEHIKSVVVQLNEGRFDPHQCYKSLQYLNAYDKRGANWFVLHLNDIYEVQRVVMKNFDRAIRKEQKDNPDSFVVENQKRGRDSIKDERYENFYKLFPNS